MSLNELDISADIHAEKMSISCYALMAPLPANSHTFSHSFFFPLTHYAIHAFSINVAPFSSQVVGAVMHYHILCLRDSGHF